MHMGMMMPVMVRQVPKLLPGRTYSSLAAPLRSASETPRCLAMAVS